ncbi:hypothetical protein CDAR_65941 [Caerostris darwini]|uniref:Uncharacterized protein n=1 Tax=Caerostris darwini TaxID=1538125 RepID=A0AAV4UC92_9ARAC|nr:hypothetical protein CDAR_65941 [Caerostris darwini]
MFVPCIRRLEDPTVEFGKQRNPFAPTCPLQFNYSASLLDNTAFAATCMSTSFTYSTSLLDNTAFAATCMSNIRRLKDPTVEFGKQRNPFAPTCPLQFTYSASLLDNTAFAATCMSTSVG